MLIGFPTDFKFTKSKKLPFGPKSNVVLIAEKQGNQSVNSSEKPMTQDQYHSLNQLLQHVKIGTHGELINEYISSANCVGPFNEEASGAW